LGSFSFFILNRQLPFPFSFEVFAVEGQITD
jgi:hypothetical protein